MTQYKVYGTVTMPREVFDNERNGILYRLMQWSPYSQSDMTFSLLNINSKTVGISFDDPEQYQENVYHEIRSSLFQSLRALKEKYPEDIKGELMIVSTDGMYYAARIELDGEEYTLFTLQRSN